MDRLQEINFWKRLEMFVKDVQVNDPMSEEEKDMILHICKEKQEEKTCEVGDEHTMD